MAKEPLEERMDPILNPNGPDKQATEELIKALSTVLDCPTARDETKSYTKAMIRAVMEGYEKQSEQGYDGFLPEDVE